MKTPEELAVEFVYQEDTGSDTFAHGLRNGFLAGYQAAKDQQRKEWETLVSKGKIAMQTLNDQLADADKVIPDTCEHILHMEKMVDVSSSVPLNNWISVKDRLPEDASDVLIVWADGVSEACYFDETWCRDGRRLLWVTHWMPLPAAPKEEG